MRQIHLWPEEPVTQDDITTVSVTIEEAHRRTSLWYRFPAEFNSYLGQGCDPFVVASLFMAMQQSAELVVHGSVSPSLITNLEEFQAAWSCWRPQHYQPITIQADLEQEQPKASGPDRAISAFSGGVDSCYTVLRHRQGLCNRQRRNLQTGMLVHGFDIPLRQTEAFEKAIVNSRKMLSSVGMDLLPLVTNIRQVIKLNWEDIFGTAIASCLMLFRGYYTAGLIPASYSYHALDFPYGSNPVSDRFLSSQSFEIVHDGPNANRVSKIRHISGWNEGLQYLRVCWEGADKYRNCGQCEKCIRNILALRIVGVENPPCFEHVVTNREIRALRVKEAQLNALQALLLAARQSNQSDSWVRALEYAFYRNQLEAKFRSYLPDSFKQELKHFLLRLKKK